MLPINIKLFTSIRLIVLSALITSASFAQAQDTTFIEDNTYQQLLNYSKPGKYHQLLADLVGNWRFKGGLVTWVDSVTSTISVGWSGTTTRKSVANGLFFITDVTFNDTIEMPGQDGKLKKSKLWVNEVEGYNNVKNEYQKSSITNQLSSGINYWKGKYDSATKTITYDCETEDIPGNITKLHLLFEFINKDHYKWKYYEAANGKYVEVTELDFTRIKDK